jgi:uncharacterized integral membrane protein
MTTDPGNPSSSPEHGSTAGSARPDTSPGAPRRVKKTRAASSYAFLVVGALVMLALVVFIVQNLGASPEVKFFGWGYQLPIGINMLISALAGAIITGLAGAIRILQLRRAYKKA